MATSYLSKCRSRPTSVLEVASESTAAIDTGAKRDDYAAWAFLEYWRL